MNHLSKSFVGLAVFGPIFAGSLKYEYNEANFQFLQRVRLLTISGELRRGRRGKRADRSAAEEIEIFSLVDVSHHLVVVVLLMLQDFTYQNQQWCAETSLHNNTW